MKFIMFASRLQERRAWIGVPDKFLGSSLEVAKSAANPTPDGSIQKTLSSLQGNPCYGSDETMRSELFQELFNHIYELRKFDAQDWEPFLNSTYFLVKQDCSLN